MVTTKLYLFSASIVWQNTQQTDLFEYTEGRQSAEYNYTADNYCLPENEFGSSDEVRHDRACSTKVRILLKGPEVFFSITPSCQDQCVNNG